MPCLVIQDSLNLSLMGVTYTFSLISIFSILLDLQEDFDSLRFKSLLPLETQIMCNDLDLFGESF